MTLSDTSPVNFLNSRPLRNNSFVRLPSNPLVLLILNTGSIGTLSSCKTYCDTSLAVLQKSLVLIGAHQINSGPYRTQAFSTEYAQPFDLRAMAFVYILLEPS